MSSDAPKILDAEKSRISRDVVIVLAAVVLSAGITVWLHVTQVVPREQAVMCGIFVLAAALWVTEAIPLFATALLVVGLQVMLLANPGDWPGLGFAVEPSPNFREFIASAADPVIVLFFGGFLLARAAVKEGVDATLAGMILRWVGHQPRWVLLALMAVTAMFSMWMSNTATAAMMVALVVPMLHAVPKGDPFRKALVLAVAFSANIGGMGTPIGSPPNAVAIGFLRNAGFEVGFLEWLLVALPLMVGLLVFCWVLLLYLFPLHQKGLRLHVERRKLTGRGWFVVAVFVMTVALWLTEAWHHVPASVVALLPAVLYSCTGTLNRNDVNTLEWSILILIAGGISLGTGMQITGLDRTFVQWLTGDGGTVEWWMLATMVLLALGLSTFMSNTAAANLLLPIGISMATTSGSAMDAVHVALAIALTASVAMALPISTPPNAIAYARGEVNTRDMAMAGTIIGMFAAALIILGSGPVLRFWGVGE